MARPRTSREMREQVFELHKNGLGPRAIARTLKIARNTVRAILRSGEGAPAGRKEAPWSKSIGWDEVAKERGKGATLKSLWRERAPEADYASFWREFNARFPKAPESTMRLAHSPGERSFFDFCDGVPIFDPATGNQTKTQLLIACLPFSGLVAGEFTLDQKQPSLVRAMQNAFAKFGGVTPYATLDNLKPAVTRAHIYDPEVNRAFTEFANHMGFAVMPALESGGRWSGKTVDHLSAHIALLGSVIPPTKKRDANRAMPLPAAKSSNF